MLFETTHGLGVDAARPVPLVGPTHEQINRWRDEMWRRKHDEGTPDPLTGRPVRLSVRCLAELFETSSSRVHDGIMRARALRQELALALLDA